jgi:hypothetical protein
MSAPETLPESVLKAKASFAIRSGNILLQTFDSAAEMWTLHDRLLAEGVDVRVEVTPAVL